MNIAYRRAQEASPDFLTIYNSYNQSVDVTLTTFVLRSVPEHVLALYDFIMTTFVPENNNSVSQQTEGPVSPETPTDTPPDQSSSSDRIRVRSRLAKFQGLVLPFLLRTPADYILRYSPTT